MNNLYRAKYAGQDGRFQLPKSSAELLAQQRAAKPVSVGRASALRDLMASVPLAVAEFEGATRSPELERRRWDASMGLIAHRIIGMFAQDAQTMTASDLLPLIAAEIGATVLPGRNDRTYSRLIGLVGQYLNLFVPPLPAKFLGSELQIAAGRVDMAWHQPGFGTYFDEIKSWRRARWIDAAEQIDRYMTAGTELFPDFVGVRFVSLGNLSACTCITVEGELIQGMKFYA